ncbi:transposase IS116/IS110/IS902 family protein [Actinoplanes sp. N902-109]|nr:transposase IS116/IS110/IS902 family protein [Actinoplanes sp. N902-109]
MCRIADLHRGDAKTDARDAFVIADAARTLPYALRRVDVGELAVEAEESLDTHPLAEARILLEVGDGTAFPTPGHLAAYVGLTPLTRRSASSIRGEHPPKGSNEQLRFAFFLAAFASLAHPPSRTCYDHERADGKRHNAALICLARCRIDVLFAMVRDRQPYQNRPTDHALAA